MTRDLYYSFGGMESVITAVAKIGVPFNYNLLGNFTNKTNNPVNNILYVWCCGGGVMIKNYRTTIFKHKKRSL